MKNLFYLTLYLVYFSTPFESVAIFTGFSVVKITSILFGITTLMYYRTIPFPKIDFVILYLIYVVYGVLSIFWSVDKGLTLKHTFGFLIPTFIITSILIYSIKNLKQVENIFKAYVLGCSVVSINALYTLLFIVNQDYGRLVVFGQDANELSFLLAFGIISSIYLIKFTDIRGLSKLLIFVFIFIDLYIILNTGSRTGFVILFIIGFIATLMYIKRIRVVLFILPLVAWLIISIFNYLSDFTTTRLLETTDQIEERDLTGRGYIWSKGLEALEDENAYFFGTGFKTFESLLNENFDMNRAAHNTYLSTLIELGIVGVIIFGGILYLLVKDVFYLYRNDSIFHFLLLIPLLMAMFTLSMETRRWLPFIAVLIIKLKHFNQLERMEKV